jgi:hypothetical protein
MSDWIRFDSAGLVSTGVCTPVMSHVSNETWATRCGIERRAYSDVGWTFSSPQWTLFVRRCYVLGKNPRTTKTRCAKLRPRGNICVRGAKYMNHLTTWCQNPKVHHRIYNSQPPVRILSHLDPLYIPPAILPKIYSEPVILSVPWSSEWSLSFGLSHQNLAHFSWLFHACHMTRPTHFPWFYLYNVIWGWVQIMKLLMCNEWLITSKHGRWC